jgi:hypothetical protein
LKSSFTGKERSKKNAVKLLHHGSEPTSGSRRGGDLPGGVPLFLLSPKTC